MPTTYTHLMDLARGGLGRVSLVSRTEGDFRRIYALKRLHAHHAEDREIRRMFTEEARIAGMLRHANVTSVLDVGEDEEGPYFIMDFVDGVSLRTAMAESQWPNPLPLSVSLSIAAQVARGLHSAHSLCEVDGEPLTVVHRDVSPANILIGFDGVVRVTDFGIAKALGSSPETSTGLLKGKLSYMAPEQLRFRGVDARTDLFSLGIVLYEMLAGARLYKTGSTDETALEILEAAPPDISEVRTDLPATLVELVFDLLAKDPEMRPTSASVVAERIEAVLFEVTEPRAESVESFVQRVFGHVREERQQKLSGAIEGTKESSILENEPTDTSVDGRKRHLWLAAGLVAALFVATGAVWVALGGELGGPDSQAQNAEPESTASEHPASENRVVDNIEPPSTPENASGTEQVLARDMEEPTEVADEQREVEQVENTANRGRPRDRIRPRLRPEAAAAMEPAPMGMTHDQNWWPR